jgi:tetratricopeptide (TPR) repeat protein
VPNMIIDFNQSLFSRYDKYYRPRIKPTYVISEDELYDPVSGRSFSVGQLSTSRIEVTDERFVLTAVDIAMLDGDYYKVIGMSDDLIGKNKSDVYALNMKAEALFNLRHTSNALGIIEKILENDGQNALAYYCRSQVHQYEENYSQALDDINMAMQCSVTPHKLDYYTKATILQMMDKADQAQEVLLEGIAIEQIGFIADYHEKVLRFQASDEEDYTSIIVPNSVKDYDM